MDLSEQEANGSQEFQMEGLTNSLQACWGLPQLPSDARGIRIRLVPP